MTTRNEQRDSIKSKIVEKARKDEGFRASLKSNPRKAIEEAMGMKIPGHVQFHVVEESASSLYVVLPENPERDLSDADLESVAGGGDFTAAMY